MSRENIDDGDSIDRRKFLRNATLATGTAVMIPGITAARDSGGIDTDPDLSSDRKIRQYAERVREMTDEEQERVFEALSGEQLDTLYEAFAPTRIEVTTVESDEAATGDLIEPDRIGGPNPATGTAKVSADNASGYNSWNWYHRIRWNHNGSSYWNVTSNQWAEVNDSTWLYDGTVSEYVNDYPRDFIAFQQGKLVWANAYKDLNANPYARLSGLQDGSFYIKDKDDGR